MWGIIVALISGALMSVQGVFNTGVTKQTSTWLASAWVAFSGFVVAIALWAIFERNQAGIFSLAQVDHKYMLLGGVIGAFITWTVITAMAGLGPAKAVLLIVISQLLIAYLIELFWLVRCRESRFSVDEAGWYRCVRSGIYHFSVGEVTFFREIRLL